VRNKVVMGVRTARRLLMRRDPKADAGPGSLRGALVEVAPSLVWVLEQDADGMVGFFVVCFGVLAG
jgi:hypothetical protein